MPADRRPAFPAAARCIALAAALALALPVAVAAPSAIAAEAVEAGIPAIQSTLYFGLSSDDGSGVSEQEWASFLAEAVTPRFPDGLTVLSAYGQGGDGRQTVVLRELTKVLIIVRPDTPEAAEKISQIKAAFTRRFGQSGVFHTDARVRIVD